MWRIEAKHQRGHRERQHYDVHELISCFHGLPHSPELPNFREMSNTGPGA